MNLNQLLKDFCIKTGESVIAFIADDSQELINPKNIDDIFFEEKIYAWTKNYIIFVHEYDDMCTLRFIQRNPILTKPSWGGVSIAHYLDGDL